MNIADLLQWACERDVGFFLRHKSNYEWEAGWGIAAGLKTVRADTAIAALRALRADYELE